MDIKAFVGHSFTEDDQDVVNRFLKYFDQLAKSQPSFSWIHAEAAEAKVLAEKVTALMADKNLFIGICTAKEIVAPLRKTNRFLSYHWANEAVFEVKTSDWIIQEIGYALGLRIKLVILLEETVRRPGGLQGDIEYIPFNRKAPEKTFGKILEMLTSLDGSRTSITSPSTALVATGSEAVAPDKSANEQLPSWLVPKPDWNLRDYRIAIAHTTLINNDSAIDALQQKYRESYLSEAPHAEAIWTAITALARLRHSSGGDLKVLRDLAAMSPDEPLLVEAYGSGLEEFKEHAAAGDQFARAAAVAGDAAEKVRLLGRAANAFAESKRPDEREKAVDEMKSLATNEAAKAQLLLAAIELYKKLSLDDFLEGAYEAYIALKPEATWSRFQLAYKYSQRSENDLALLHYTSIPDQLRDGVTWNNLGVGYKQFDMPAKSVSAYRNSEEKSETLAMANLANVLMDVGFLPEAQGLIDKGLAATKPHSNVGSALARIRSIPDAEGKTEGDVVDKARPKSLFLRDFGQAAMDVGVQDLSGDWIGPECLLRLQSTKDAIKVVGQFDRPANRLTLGSLAMSTVTVAVAYEGRAIGRAFRCSIRRKASDESPSAIADLMSSNIALMVLAADGTHIRVMELNAGSAARFYDLTRSTT